MADYILDDVADWATLPSLNPGDRVLWQPGTYSPTAELAMPSDNGDPGNPIVYGAVDPSNRPRFDFSGVTGSHGFRATNRDNLVVQDWHIIGPDNHGIAVQVATRGPNNCIFRRLVFEDCGKMGLSIGESANWVSVDTVGLRVEDVYGINLGRSVVNISLKATSPVIRRCYSDNNGVGAGTNSWGVNADGINDVDLLSWTEGPVGTWETTVPTAGREVAGVIIQGDSGESIYHYSPGTFDALSDHQWAKNGDTIQIKGPTDPEGAGIQTTVVYGYCDGVLMEDCGGSNQSGPDGVVNGFDKGTSNGTIRRSRTRDSNRGVSFNNNVQPAVEFCLATGMTQTGARANRPGVTVDYRGLTSIGAGEAGLYLQKAAPASLDMEILNCLSSAGDVSFKTSQLLATEDLDFCCAHGAATQAYEEFTGSGGNNVTDDPLVHSAFGYLSSGSSCIAAGDQNAAGDRDVYGRIFMIYTNGRTDIGAVAYRDDDPGRLGGSPVAGSPLGLEMAHGEPI